jgi:hypothetical protein
MLLLFLLTGRIQWYMVPGNEYMKLQQVLIKFIKLQLHLDDMSNGKAVLYFEIHHFTSSCFFLNHMVFLL